MFYSSMSPAIVACLILASAGSPPTSRAGGWRATAIERYGLVGHTQAVGIHHGFHIETVAADSPAAMDGLKAHDVVMRVDGESIRSLDHLRAVLAEAYIDDGEVSISYTRGDSLEHHVLKGHLRAEAVKPVAKRRRPPPVDDGR